MTKKANERKNKVPIALKIQHVFHFFLSLCAHRCVFLGILCLSGYHFEAPGTLQIDKIRVRLRKGHGPRFWNYFDALLNAVLRLFKDVHGEASSVRIAIGPLAQPSVVEEPDGYVCKQTRVSGSPKATEPMFP